MNLNEMYKQLAAELGDIVFKQQLMEQKRLEVIAKIEALNTLASQPSKAQGANETQEKKT
jgi:hypothetical protein